MSAVISIIASLLASPLLSQSNRSNEKGHAVRLEMVASTCETANCPTIWTDGSSRIFIQGDMTDDESLRERLSLDEGMVAIPVDLLLEAAKRLTTSASMSQPSPL